MTGSESARSDEDRTPRVGRNDSWKVAGSDAEQPEIAEGPAEGLEPGEEIGRGPWHAPVEADPPPVTGRGRPAGEDAAVEAGDPGAEEETRDPHDPGRTPEEEGVPDLQDGTPEQQRASDPQRQAVPGDAPTAATRDAPTPEEMREGQTLDERLAQEEPERESPVPGVPDERTGQLSEEPEATPPRRQDVHAEEGGSGEALSAEEEAVRTKYESRR